MINNMLTSEEIKKLSEECALYYQSSTSNKGNNLSNRLTIETYSLMTLKWLSKDYCIVPKSKVKKWYNSAKVTSGYFPESSKVSPLNFAKSIIELFNGLFGKSLFEEEEE